MPRYLPHMAVATLCVIGLPALVVTPVQAHAGLHPLVAILLAMALSVAASTVGSALWMRGPGSRDLVFADLMVWGWLRRRRADRRMTQAAELLGHGQLSAEAHAEVLEQLAAGLEARDPTTHGHSTRVARHSERIARRMGMHGDDVAKIRAAAAVHDVGKVNTPRSILLKPGRLDEHEFEQIRRHAVDGARMVAPVGDAQIAAYVRGHHERMDGSGYPDGLAGDAVPLGARIIAVADTFDAMTSGRPYRRALSHKRALDTLSAEAGTKLDARAVAAFRSYYSGGRAVATSAFLMAAPSRLLSWLGGGVSGGVSPLAQGASALGAAALLGGALVGGAARPERDHRSVPTLAGTVPVLAQPFADAVGDPTAGGRVTPRRGPSGGGTPQSDRRDRGGGGGGGGESAPGAPRQGEGGSGGSSPGTGSPREPEAPPAPSPTRRPTLQGQTEITAPPVQTQLEVRASLPRIPLQLPAVEIEVRSDLVDEVTQRLPELRLP